jgi:hypothetical protein
MSVLHLSYVCTVLRTWVESDGSAWAEVRYTTGAVAGLRNGVQVDQLQPIALGGGRGDERSPR